MAGKTAILSVRIVSDADRGVAGLTRAAGAVTVLDRAARRGGAGLRSMALATPKVLALGLAIMTLGAATLTSLGHVAAFVAALAPLGGLVLGLPGLFAGVAVGMTVLKMAFKDAKKELGDLAPRFQALQQSVSASFWEQAASPIRALALATLPTLDRALSNTGGILGRAFASGSKAAQSTLSTVLGPALSDINTGFHNASAGVAPFVRALLNLTGAGTTVLPRIGTAVAGVAARFDKWVSATSADGRLTGWINGGLTALRQLGSVIGSVVGIVGGLGKAMANGVGGGTLGTMAASLREVSAAINGPVGQDTLGKVMSSAGTIMRGVAPGVRTLASSLTSLGPVVQTLASQVGPILSPALSSLGGVIRALAPHLQSLAAAMGPALATAVSALGKTLPGIAQQLGPIVSTLGKGLAQVITALAPKLAQVGTAFSGLLAAVRPLVNLLMPVLVPALKFIGGILLGAVKGAIEGVTQVIRGITQVISGIISFVKNVFAGNWRGAWNSLVTIAKGVFNIIVGAIKTWLNVSVLGIFRTGALKLLSLWRGGWTSILSAGRTALTAIRGAVTGGLNAVRNTFSTVLNFVRNLFAARMRAMSSTASAILSTIRGVFSRGFSAITSAVSSGIARARSFFTAGITAIKSAATGGIGNVVRLFVALPGKIVGALRGLSSKMTSTGKDIIRGLISGVTSMASGLVNKVKDTIGGAIKGAKDMLGIASPSKVFRRFGVFTGEGWVLGLSKMMRRSRQAMTDLVEPVAPAALEAPRLSYGSGRGESRRAGGVHLTVNFTGVVTDRLAVARELRSLMADLDLIEGRA